MIVVCLSTGRAMDDEKNSIIQLLMREMTEVRYFNNTFFSAKRWSVLLMVTNNRMDHE